MAVSEVKAFKADDGSVHSTFVKACEYNIRENAKALANSAEYKDDLLAIARTLYSAYGNGTQSRAALQRLYSSVKELYGDQM